MIDPRHFVGRANREFLHFSLCVCIVFVCELLRFFIVVLIVGLVFLRNTRVFIWLCFLVMLVFLCVSLIVLGVVFCVFVAFWGNPGAELDIP